MYLYLYHGTSATTGSETEGVEMYDQLVPCMRKGAGASMAVGVDCDNLHVRQRPVVDLTYCATAVALGALVLFMFISFIPE